MKRNAVGGLGLVFCALLACGNDKVTTSATASKPVVAMPAPTPEKREPTVAEQLASASTLEDALKVIQPLFIDTTDALDPAVVVFSLWASKNLLWSAIQSLPETKHALVMKDPTAERGKRNCYAGTIIEIEVDRSGGVPVYLGGIMTNGGQMARFVAVGSTGELVERSPARFCGVVTGRSSYSNAAGGTTHAVQLVGMFDLPANKTVAPKLH